MVLKILDFNTVIKKHGESLIQHIVEIWERYNNVHYLDPLPLEERWTRFIDATNDNQADVSFASNTGN